MDMIMLGLEILVLLGLGGILLLGKRYLPSYVTEKGKNLATKEDVGEITDRIEEVRADYSTELEKVRAELRVSAHQEEVRFSRLHELRAEAIVELYRRLVRTEELFQQLAGGLVISTSLSREELERKASESGNELISFYSERRLFFDQGFIEAFEELRGTLVRSFNTLMMVAAEDLTRMSKEERKEIIERRREARDAIRERLPALISDLEGRMRNLLEGGSKE